MSVPRHRTDGLLDILWHCTECFLLLYDNFKQITRGIPLHYVLIQTDADCRPVLLREVVHIVPGDNQTLGSHDVKITRCGLVHELHSIVLDGSKLLGKLGAIPRSEEHTSELQSRPHLVCRL